MSVFNCVALICKAQDMFGFHSVFVWCMRVFFVLCLTLTMIVLCKVFKLSSRPLRSHCGDNWSHEVLLMCIEAQIMIIQKDELLFKAAEDSFVQWSPQVMVFFQFLSVLDRFSFSTVRLSWLSSVRFSLIASLQNLRTLIMQIHISTRQHATLCIEHQFAPQFALWKGLQTGSQRISSQISSVADRFSSQISSVRIVRIESVRGSVRVGKVQFGQFGSVRVRSLVSTKEPESWPLRIN